MPIQVTCPNCLKRFQVSDKFAGKTGPCPNCKKQLKVPEVSEEVVVHVPDDGTPKTRSGESVLKPIKRSETDVTKKGLVITAGAILAVFGVALGFRMMGGDAGTPLWAQLVGLLALAPPLVWAGYSFVYDQECEPYVGRELRDRVLICSVIFAFIWVIYAFVPAYVLELDHANEMSYTTAAITFFVMLGLGGFASSAIFELEYSSGLIHAGLYFISIVLLAVVSGVPLAGEDVVDPLRSPLANVMMSTSAVATSPQLVNGLDCWELTGR